MLNYYLLPKAILFVAILCISTQIRAVTISFELSNNSPDLQSDFEIEVWINDLNTDIVSAFDISLSFDANYLEFQQIEFDTFLGDGIDSLQDNSLSTNVLTLSEVSYLFDSELSALQTSGSLRLATIKMKSIRTGTSQIDLQSAEIVGENFSAINNNFAGPVAFTTNPVQVPIGNVWYLMFAGVFFLMMKSKYFEVNYREGE